MGFCYQGTEPDQAVRQDSPPAGGSKLWVRGSNPLWRAIFLYNKNSTLYILTVIMVIFLFVLCSQKSFLFQF